LNEVPPEAEEPFKVMLEARMRAFELVRPGVRAADVDAAVLHLLGKRGFQERVLHRTGHGLGVTSHEPPWIAVGGSHVIEEGMVVSIEPGVYLPGMGGFRHSDTVLVTRKGCLALTQSPDLMDDLIY
jgi:Xaa-Pro dipeptidase